MEVWREGNLTDSDIRTGDILSLELNGRDASALTDPKQGMVMNRFMGFKRSVAGWAHEDKAQVELKKPRSLDDRLAELRLDGGGDLYFTIWDTDKLRNAEMCEVFNNLDEFVTADPSQVLARLGIKSVRIYYLPVITMAKNNLL